MVDRLSASSDGPAVGRFATFIHCLTFVAGRQGLNLSESQLIKDNPLPDGSATTADFLRCARRAGLKAKVRKLARLSPRTLRRVLPGIVTLKSGASMVLVAADIKAQRPHLYLQDPTARDNDTLVVDISRFDDASTGEVILVQRRYGISEDERPFGVGLIASLLFRERRVVRDVVICAFILSAFAIAPIMFWRLLSDKVIYYASAPTSMNTFVILSLGVLTIFAFESLLTYVRARLSSFITVRVDTRMSEYIFDRVLRLPMDYFERVQVGVIGHYMEDSRKIRSFLDEHLFGSVLDSLMLFIFVPVMYLFSPLLTAIVVGICGLIVAWLLLMLPTARRVTSAVTYAESMRGAFLYQNLLGMRTVKSLALETPQRRIWDFHIKKIVKLRYEAALVTALIEAGVKLLERLAVSGTLGLAVYFVITTRDPILLGSVFAFYMLAQRVSGPLMQMAHLVNQYDEAATAIALIAHLVNQPKEEGSGDRGLRTPLRGRVEFQNVRFKYNRSASFAIDGVTFEAPIGQTLGVVGRSGSGKTTLTRLLQRLHSNFEGMIKIDGVDVRDYDLAHLRRSLGVVLQENFLFTGTIRENIAAGKPEATFDEVVRAARLAGAEEFIDRLQRGYETHIYEGSPNLSGGQKQRLAIARALIVDPRILILDEATSALDPDSEAIVNENIRRIAQGRTVIVISHRLSSLVSSDAILVMERGKVVDVGKHYELLERCDIYNGLWAQQNRHIEAASRPLLARAPARVS